MISKSVRDDERIAQQVGGDEPPPRFSVQRRAAVREHTVRSTVRVGGGRSPLSFYRAVLVEENPPQPPKESADGA